MLRVLTFVALISLIGCVEASGAQLTVSWIDNSGGQAAFSVERRLGSDAVFGAIGNVPPGVTSYVDGSVAQGSTYCYRVLAYDTDTVSPYSNEACGSPGSQGITVTISKAGTGSGTVTSTPAGIKCGTACSVTYPVGTLVTLAATPHHGSVFDGWSGGGCAGTAPCNFAGDAPVTVTAQFTATGTAALRLTYRGMLRDRVGQGNAALAADGALDGTFTATLRASGGRTVTALTLQSTGPGTWDTDASTGSWALGVATSLDGVLLNQPGTMAVNFAVPDGGTLVLFASDYADIEFVPGAILTLTATFSDGTTATAVTRVR